MADPEQKHEVPKHEVPKKGTSGGGGTSPWLYFILGGLLIAVVAYGAYDYWGGGMDTAEQEADVNITTGIGGEDTGGAGDQMGGGGPGSGQQDQMGSQPQQGGGSAGGSGSGSVSGSGDDSAGGGGNQ